ncbi:MAG: glycoside hydrolase family 31 protein [Bacteroidota bacterium]
MGKQKEKNQLVPLASTEGHDRYPDVYHDFIPDRVSNIQKRGNTVRIDCENGIALKIYILNPGIIRLRYAVKGEFEQDFSYAIDPQFKASRLRSRLEESDKGYCLMTSELMCKITKEGLKVHFFDSTTRKSICRESGGFSARSTILKGLTHVTIEKKAPKNEQYFGLGDKSCALNLRDKQLQNWTTDAFGYGKDSDPLYRAVPFYYGLFNGRAYGIFMDNPYRSHFHFGGKKSRATTFSAEGGEMNYYFIYGPDLHTVAKRYTQLTGTPDLPPLWALGFHQCRWSYYPESRVMELAQQFRNQNIPCDAIYLDIDYMDGYRCFTWDNNHFPDPQKMISRLRNKGFRTVVMIDPGIKVDNDYNVYAIGKARNYFCRRAEGELMIGPVWPADCAFPDFTNPKVRQWWGTLYKSLYQQMEVDGFWNDMNEPAVFKINRKTFPDDVRHDYDGQGSSHKKAHNIYGLNMTRATYDGLKKLKPRQRPFLLTRATFAGGQRYASVWTGDNIASWEHLQMANRQCQRLSISGFSFNGTDIGGFVDLPSGELFVRWLQLGIFHPLFRVHSMGNNEDGAGEIDMENVKAKEAINRMDQEPWAFGEPYTDYARQAIQWRYQWLPYLYTAFWQYSTSGRPMLQSLVFEDQHDPVTHKREQEFIFGDHLLVAPVCKPGLKSQKVYLPKGHWYNYWTGKALKGAKKFSIATPIERIPLFVRAGAIFPHYPIQQYTGQKKINQLSLHAYYGREELKSQLYEDSGDGFEHHKGQFSLRHYRSGGTAQEFYIEQLKEGRLRNSYRNCKIFFHGLPFKPSSCMVDGKKLRISRKTDTLFPVYSVVAPKNFQKLLLNAKS